MGGPSDGGYRRPKARGAGGRKMFAEQLGPFSLATKLVAPSPKSARVMMQAMFLRKSNRPVGLMRDGGARARRFAAANLRCRDRRREPFAPARNRIRGDVGRNARGSRLARQHGKSLLYRLKSADRAAELLALFGVLRRHGGDSVKRSRHHERARRGAGRARSERVERRQRDRNPFKANRVTRITSDVDPGLDVQRGSRNDEDDWTIGGLCYDHNRVHTPAPRNISGPP
jgi:hypothetical protein